MYFDYRETCLGPQAVTLVERLIMQCPFLGESTVGGSTVLLHIHTRTTCL